MASKMISTALCAAILTTYALTANAQQRGDGGDGGDGMPMGHGVMMDQEQMTQMRDHLQEMRTMMMQIREAEDPERRRKLMQERMMHMQSAMENMNGAGMGQGDSQDMARMSTEERMAMMQNHMEMMQMMMNQMMEHMSVRQGEGTEQ